MRRRTFLAGLGFAALQLEGCAVKPQTTPDYVLTYADNQPAGYPTTQGAQYFADLVQQQTGGKVVGIGQHIVRCSLRLYGTACQLQSRKAQPG